MNGKWKYFLKILCTVVVILVIPIVFFQYVGQNPMKVHHNATRQIAVVNEDNGVQEKNQDPVQFGKEIVPILKEDSDYKWNVVDRSTAENGLKNLKYDAAVYIPSKFSNNVLTYDEDQPEKADLTYDVQKRLGSTNKEKVQKELENSSHKVKDHISSLYWSYVSQQVGHVRKQFDNILDKEIAFQDAMINFYSPTSKNLSDKFAQQKKSLKQLKSRINSAKKGSTNRKKDVGEVNHEMTSFVDNVQDYKRYQSNQQQLLSKVQNQSEQSIGNGKENVADTKEKLQNDFNNKADSLVDDTSQIQNKLDNNNQLASNLHQQRMDDIGEQKEQIIKPYSNSLLDQYQKQYQDIKDKQKTNNLHRLEGKMKQSLKGNKAEEEPEGIDETEDGTDNRAAHDTGKDDDVMAGNDQANGEINGQESSNGNEGQDGGEEEDQDQGNLDNPDPSKQQQKLKQTRKSLNQLKSNLGTLLENETLPDSVKKAIHEQMNEITNINEQIGEVKDELNNNDRDWKGEIDKLNNRINDLEKQLKEQNGDLKEKDKKINNQEEKIKNQSNKIKKQEETMKDLNKDIDNIRDQLKNMNGKNKETKERVIKKINREESKVQNLMGNDHYLNGLFGKDLNKKSVEQLFDYKGFLSEYKATLEVMNGWDKPKREEIIKSDNNKEKVDDILAPSDKEQKTWDKLHPNLEKTKKDMKVFKKSTRNFVDGYNDYIGKQQHTIMNSIDAMQKSAKKVDDKLQNTDGLDEFNSGSGKTPDGTLLLSVQQSMGQELKNMNQYMAELGSSQSNIIDHTNNLQQKVNKVQDNADQLNNKWSKNVHTTKNVKNNFYDILGNTFVDGQDNGYVYNYLSDPVQVSGDVPSNEEKTMPPVVVMVIILISSMLIGYFTHYYREAPFLVQGALFGLLNLIVGLMISILSLDIYSLADDKAIQWSIFTIILLIATSTVVRVAFWLSTLIGWFVSMGLILYFITPLLNMAMPNFNYDDPVSDVYMSVQYGSSDLLVKGVVVLLAIIIVLMAIPMITHIFQSGEGDESEQATEG